jgi:hypothetical protein
MSTPAGPAPAGPAFSARPISKQCTTCSPGRRISGATAPTPSTGADHLLPIFHGLVRLIVLIYAEGAVSHRIITRRCMSATCLSGRLEKVVLERGIEALETRVSRMHRWRGDRRWQRLARPSAAGRASRTHDHRPARRGVHLRQPRLLGGASFRHCVGGLRTQARGADTWQRPIETRCCGRCAARG